MKKVRNKFEALFQARNPDLEYETLKLGYTIEHTYNPDFIDHESKTIFETKGLWEPADRRKILAVIKQHPGWRLVMVFQNPNRTISKKSKTTYAAFCERHCIEWQTLK